MECDENAFNVSDVDKNTEALCENNQNNESLKFSKDQGYCFLSASDLFAIRENLFKNKSKEDLELYKGHKFYFPSDCTVSEKIIEDIMTDNKKSLKLERIAKNKDCLKAEWNEKDKVAVLPYLKGKTSQHIGTTISGKCALSPEEALFLLEKGVIEIECNKMPLSVEEAYSVMLKGKLAVEKYEVYTHLSQQGFIVVHHQSRIGSNYLKVMNLSKKKKRKRKAEVPTELPEKKRLTFSGVFTSSLNSVNAENNFSHDCLLGNEVSSSNDNFISSNILKNDENITNANEKIDPDFSNDVVSSNFDEADSHADRQAISNNDMSSNFTGINLHASLEKEKSVTSYKEQIKQDNHVKELDVSEKDNQRYITASNTYIKDKHDKNQAVEKESEINKNEIKIAEFNDDKNEANIMKIDENVFDNESTDNNEIDIENINKEPVKSDNDTSEVIIEEDQKSDVNVVDSGSDYDDNEDYESSDESIPVVCEDSNEESLDVYSCSPSNNQGDKDINFETDNLINLEPSKVQDEEITLVTVMKKEKKPLAVIDLLSDEEDNSENLRRRSATNGKNTFEDSDEEIQVLDEVSGTGNNKEPSNQNISSIKLESTNLKTEPSVEKREFKPQMKYPDTFRKDMICIPRPPISLLPIRCQPAKEAYVLHTEKSSQSRPNQSRPNQSRPNRLWNSYKDMQEYQRERRREKQRNSFPSRSSGSFRDQNDTFSNQISPFCPPEYPRDMGIDRNYNYSNPTCRNFYQPANSERGLLPNPGGFSSPNQLPFSMNVHSLQNLSTANPAAFVNEIQKTVYSVASNMISNIFNQHLNPINPHPAAFNNSPFMNFNPNHNNNLLVPPGGPNSTAYNSSGRNDYNPVMFPPEPAFSGERHVNENPFMMENNWRRSNNFRQKNFTPRGPSFPCKYRTVPRKRFWSDVKAAVEGTNLSDSGSDIEEVPINLNRFLYSNDIKPLVDPGTKLPVVDGLKSLKLTQVANLHDTKRNIDRFLPTTLTLEISFDVYQPNTKYRRSEPSAPNYRIIVLRASDPIPRYSELINLQRKWNDGAILQVAVVDHGDISFYSFNSINIQELVPFDSLHQ